MSCAPPSMHREVFPLTTATPRGWQNLHRRGQQLLSKEETLGLGDGWMVPGRGISTLDVIQLWAKIWSTVITGSTETVKSVP